MDVVISECWSGSPLQRLKTGNALRRHLEEALAHGPPSDDLLGDLCRMLRTSSGLSRKERVAVCWFLRNATEAQAPRAAEALCEAVAAHDTEALGRAMGAAARFLGALALVVGYRALSEHHSDPLYWLLDYASTAWLPVAVLVIPFSYLIEERRTTWCRGQALQSLGLLADPYTVRVVARAAVGGNAAVLLAAAEAIVPILNAITAEHRDALDHTIPDICELLRHRSPAVRLAAIEALGRFAGGRAVEPVNDLTFERNPPEIEEALARVLPILRERQRQEREAASLLRPAQAPTGAADVLLRPAPGAPERRPEALLRPVDGGSSDDGTR